MGEIPLDIIWNLGIALLLGLIVGIEREFQHYRQHIQIFAGIRTFTLFALFGWLIGFLTQQLGEFTLVLVAISGMIALSMVTYVVMVWKKNLIGITNEISALIVFFLGILVSYNYILVALISAVVMTTILSYKYYLHKIAQKLLVEEIHAGLKLAIISVVVLPLLPNQSYSLTDIPHFTYLFSENSYIYTLLSTADIFNPFKIWLLVVFICALSTVGYIFMKTIGAKKGIGLTGAIGGLVSSTAVTSSLTSHSKKSKCYNTFAFGVLVAWTVMFFRVLFITLVLNKEVFLSILLPIGVMGITSVLCFLVLYLQRTPQGKKTDSTIKFKSPFALLPALKLTAFFVGILVISKIMQSLLGQTGIYISSVVAGLTDVDAITMSMVTLSSSQEITVSVAVTAITLAVVSNTIVKTGIAYLFGGKEFAKRIAIASACILTAGLITLFFI